MKKTIKNVVALFSVFIFSSTFAANQTAGFNNADISPSHKQWWLNLSLGVGRGSDLLGGTFLGGGTYRLSEHGIISARFLRTYQFIFDDSKFTDVGLMYGLIKKWQYGYISGSTGLSFVQYDRHDSGLFVKDHRVQTINTIGLPLQVNLFLTPTKYVGIGLIGFSDINSAKVVSGALLALQFGNWD